MVTPKVTKLEILVAGDPGSGKENFINRFLNYYPSCADVRRKSDTVYLLYNPDEALKIQLHDVNSVENIDRSFLNEMDVIVFYYAANDLESFQNLQKWIGLMRYEVEKDPSRIGEEVQSFLVVDMSNLGGRQNLDECFADKAKKLQEASGINRFIQISSQDEESVSSAFQTIMNEVSRSKLDKSDESLDKEAEEYLKDFLPESLRSELVQWYSDMLHSRDSKNDCKKLNAEISNLSSILRKLQTSET